ncbi:protein timeless isoform X2 [Hetaerina americana]|uniref:protein timeless isoform X2 n=1 Tax=Hetaerina americana TaxID=62018 RepID=UPI003A7F537F
MEWYIVQSQDLYGLFSLLGSKVGEEYKVGEKCLDSLGEILGCLLTEDPMIRNFRRALGISQVIQKDLIPLLIYSKDNKKVIDATIRVLVNLTLPVECLLPVESISQTENGHQIISDLNCLLMSAKQEFVEPRVTQCLVQRMRETLDFDGKMSPDDCDNIGNCLLLLRNILHIPENKANRVHSLSRVCHSTIESNGSGSNAGCNKQNLILWNLFAQNFDKVLIRLMTCQLRAKWEVPLVQLIALTFKDQRMASLLKMLHMWLETSMSSESSEDNESNTSPQPVSSGNSSPVLTSESTSDSSDNGGGTNEGDKTDRTKIFPADRSDIRNISKGQFDDASMVKEKERKNEISVDKSCSSEDCESGSIVSCNNGVQEEMKVDLAVDRKEEKGKVEQENEMQEMVSEQCGRVNEDAESGVFSQTSNQNMPSACEKKHKSRKKDQTLPNSVNSSSQKRGVAMSEQSDCGYSTQVENQPESMSTSSNEDEGPMAKRKPGHQKHHNIRQHRKVDLNGMGSNANSVQHLKMQKYGPELSRKRLVKRSRMHSANIKAMVHYNPTDDDISNLLKEFTLDFMSQGYGLLMSGIHFKLLSSCSHRVPGIESIDPPPVIFSSSSMPMSPTILRPKNGELPPPPIDTSHFFWLITFFLRFSSQLGLEFENISMVLSYDILSYLVYEGVGLCEEVQLALHHYRELDIKTCLRRIHLVVTAIREFVQAVETYGKLLMTMPGRESDRAHLQNLQKQMASTRDLRCLFVLLLQHCDLSIMSRQYLQDIVVTNHVLLLFLESGGGIVEPENDDCETSGSRRNSLIEEQEMAEHITHFANGSIVQQYGHLLEAFQENGEFVNDCIFTMLHHIGGVDVNRSDALFQPTLLWAFSAMWETGFDMCDDWSDLIEYIIYKFISNPQHGMNGKNVKFKKNILHGGKRSTMVQINPENGGCCWTVEELRDLYWFYAKSQDQNKVLNNIVQLFHEKYGVRKTTKEVLKTLLSQEIIDFKQFAALKNKELPDDITLDNVISAYASLSTEEDAEKLAANLVKEGLERVIHWLQDALLEACYVKLCMKRQRNGDQGCNYTQFPVMEPIAYHYAVMGQPIPIVPWGVEEHSAVVENTSFRRLLHCLGIQKPREDGIGGIYPRIPNSLSPLELLEAARKLGKLTPGKLKFDPAELIVEDKGAEDIWGGGQWKIPSPMPPSLTTNSNTSPGCFLSPNTDQKPIKSSPPDTHSLLTTRSGSQKNPQEMNISMIRSSNISWFNIVKRSKSPALISNQKILR